MKKQKYVIAQHGTDISISNLNPLETTRDIKKAKFFSKKEATKETEKIGGEFKVSKPIEEKYWL